MDNHVHGPSCGCAEFMFNENADDLLASIDLESVQCLNEGPVGMFSMWNRKNYRKQIEHSSQQDYFIESDTDAEIIVVIPFVQTVRVKSINIISFDEQTAASEMNAYINIPNVDFEIVQGPAAQHFILSPNLDGDYACAVKLTVFENVNQLILHISSKANDPIRISYIGIKGIKTEMKRQHVNIIYEVNPLPKEIDPTKNTQVQMGF